MKGDALDEVQPPVVRKLHLLPLVTHSGGGDPPAPAAFDDLLDYLYALFPPDPEKRSGADR